MGLAYQSTQGSNGTITMTQAAAPNVRWNLTSLSVSIAGPTGGLNSAVTVWDGAVGSGTVIHKEFLSGPGSGSVGSTTEVKIPKDAAGRFGLQATAGNAMNIQVTGTGVNQVSINARFTDGLP